MVVFLISTTIYAQSTQNYLLGDVNRDGMVTVTDAMMVVNIILNGYTSFSVSPTAVTIPAGGTATIDIKGGYNEYEVTSSNSDVVTASLSGSTITLDFIAPLRRNGLTEKGKMLLIRAFMSAYAAYRLIYRIIGASSLTRPSPTSEPSMLSCTSMSKGYMPWSYTSLSTESSAFPAA